MFHVAAQALPRSALRAESLEETKALWSPPVQKVFNGETQAHVCVRVRIATGDDADIEYTERFPPGTPVTANEVCSRIANRKGLSDRSSKLFGVWVSGRDLEFEIQPLDDIVKLTESWNLTMVRMTHFPQAVDPSHFVNRYWLTYRRKANIHKDCERELSDDVAEQLLYAEAKRNVLNGRYPCKEQDAVNLAALQLQSMFGDFDPENRPPSLFANRAFLSTVLPSRVVGSKSSIAWARLMSAEHQRLVGTTPRAARAGFLTYFRVQRWLAGLSTDGLVVFERRPKPRFYFVESWDRVSWTYSADTFMLYPTSGRRRHRAFRLVTPQAGLMHSVASRLATREHSVPAATSD
ncbi:FERM central domain-containing protein [Zopfochytrium polystomum]|nr:FERM central domain-containing protein [Zopfochytrium polystomum]